MWDTWFNIFFYTGYAITVIAGVTALFCVWPAYKQTRHRAFLFLAAAFALGVFDAICDHTLGVMKMAPSEQKVYLIVRDLAYYATSILPAVGVILLTRSYLAALPRTDVKPPV